MINTDFDLVMKPLQVVPVPPDVLNRIRGALLLFDGEPTMNEVREDGAIVESWSCGLTAVTRVQAKLFQVRVYSRYGMRLLEVLQSYIARVAVQPTKASGAPELGGLYIVMGGGTGNPEACRFFGPVTPAVLAKLQHPQVIKDLALVITPFTSALPQVTGVDVEPRVIAMVEDIRHWMVGSTYVQPLSKLIEDAADSDLIEIGNALLVALAADPLVMHSEVERAATRVQLMKFRCRLAQGLIALGLA